MIGILPAILATSEEEFVRKVERVRSLGLVLHVDVMDGAFTKESTWAPPERMHALLRGMEYDAHLMVQDPHLAIPHWLTAGARKILIHAEAVGADSPLAGMHGDSCVRMGVAINPDTPEDELFHRFSCSPACLAMGVIPGRSGQPMFPRTIDKVRALREVRPELWIQVDGGVNEANVGALAKAGANELVMGSALTDADDPADALKRVRQALARAGFN